MDRLTDWARSGVEAFHGLSLLQLGLLASLGLGLGYWVLGVGLRSMRRAVLTALLLVAAVGASFSADTTKNGWFGMPDNLAVDNQGRIWIATDGNSGSKTGRSDGIWGVETEGPLRGTSKHFFRVPVGAEMCGPFFTPDDETLFVAVQHPGEADEDDPKAEPATFEKPATRWPDFKDGVPPRPSIVAITRKGGGKIGA